MMGCVTGQLQFALVVLWSSRDPLMSYKLRKLILVSQISSSIAGLSAVLPFIMSSQDGLEAGVSCVL